MFVRKGLLADPKRDKRFGVRSMFCFCMRRVTTKPNYVAPIIIAETVSSRIKLAKVLDSISRNC